ncbi:MAG: 50S ribosomal protein L9, partial [Candidatus Atribacteria bacterium]|nr:50S ribosomal protein L9 [Candidatus Atribacteria bacterium]
TKKAGEKGKLFGSVTTKEIADQLSEVVGFEFDRKFIELDEPIKEVGEREIRLNFGKGFHTMVKMKISSEETREEKES